MTATVWHPSMLSNCDVTGKLKCQWNNGRDRFIAWGTTGNEVIKLETMQLYEPRCQWTSFFWRSGLRVIRVCRKCTFFKYLGGVCLSNHCGSVVNGRSRIPEVWTFTYFVKFHWSGDVCLFAGFVYLAQLTAYSETLPITSWTFYKFPKTFLPSRLMSLRLA